jgi:hypothetical protein
MKSNKAVNNQDLHSSLDDDRKEMTTLQFATFLIFQFFESYKAINE